MKTSFLSLLLPVLTYGQDNLGDIQSCQDMVDLFDRAGSESVTATMDPFQDVICDEFTTITLDSGYDVTILSSEDDLDNFFGRAVMRKLRLEVLGGSKVTFEVNTGFELDLDEDDYPDVNGGALYIGQDSNVVFLNDFHVTDVGVRSETVDGSDFPDHQNDGGVINNNGFFRVNGDATFERCENSGGGEGSPGRGGCVFNGENGSMVFEGDLEMSDVSITDDEGNSGGGFYNLGKVNVKGDSLFDLLRAETGGAIFNGEGATFNFRSGGSTAFVANRAQDGNGGSVHNLGNMNFRGPVLFLQSTAEYLGGAVFNSGSMKFGDMAIFFDVRAEDFTGAPVYVDDGGELDFKESDVVFLDIEVDELADPLLTCKGVYFEGDDACIE